MNHYQEYPFRGQEVPCTSAGQRTLSTSTACSLQDPFTPPPGPSTPEQVPVMMGHLHMGCGTIGMGVTPPHSNFGANFAPRLHSPQYMNPGYNAYTHPQLVTPPVEYAPTAYPTDHMNQYDAMQSWAWPQDGQAVYFDTNTPGAGTVISDHRPQSYFSAQEKTAVLHKVQTRARVTKRSKMPMVMVENKNTDIPGIIPAILYEPGKHKCTHPGCDKLFRRQEHLKRHLVTVHSDHWIVCKLCQGTFNREDNYRVHLKLHTKKSGRTKYYPESIPLYDEVMRNTKQRRRTKKEETRAKAAQ
ncbi:hypothetical protein F4678DRAFT_461846 [Xylaria arbuscula]|nr:hypothetical protein F4678DRAFT_461846 [Xylaria arbuscula]